MKIKKNKNTIQLILFSAIYLFPFVSKAQEVGFGTGDRYGIYFGNPDEFNGIRLTLIPTSSPMDYKDNINGLSMGIAVVDSIDNGLSLAVLGRGCYKCNGIGVAPENACFIVNGVAVGLFTLCVKSNGLVAGMATYGGRKLNGITIGLLDVLGPQQKDTLIINGVVIAGAYIESGEINGLSIAAIVKSKKQNGVSIAGFNRTKKLYGVQLGLLNYVGNNPKIFRWLPFINMHLGK